jgi:hypothetical protein
MKNIQHVWAEVLGLTAEPYRGQGKGSTARFDENNINSNN